MWASYGTAEDLPRLVKGVPNAVDYARKMLPPDSAILPRLVEPTVETVQMALTSMGLAVFVAIPVSFLAARNTAPHAGVYAVTRGILNVLRGLPPFIWALLFIAMVGLGPMAGIAAMAVYTVGSLGKLCSEAIEAFDADYLEAMQIDGASELQIMYHGILPGLAALFVSYILYRFEATVRAATVLGMVGAGGIGLELTQAIRAFKRREALTVILVILALVTLIDLGSRLVRTHLLPEV